MLFLTLLVSIAFWFEFTLANYWGDRYSYDFHIEHLPVSISVFLFAYTYSHWLRLRPSVIAKDYAAILAVWSLRFGLVLMLIMSFREPWRELIHAHWQYMTSMWVIVSLISAVTLFLAYKVNKLTPVIYILPFYVVSILVIQQSADSNYALHLQIIYNLVLVITGIWLIIRAMHTGTSHYFYLGVLTILLTALMRYFDLIGSYIEGALLFMVFAVVLISAAKFWKRNQPEEVLS